MTTPQAAEQATPQPVVAVLGTGIIGAPVARNLAKGGFTVRAWNRTRAKADALAADGVHVADTPAEAVDGADVVLTVLNDGPRVLEAVRAAAPKLAAGTVWVQVSTVGEDIDEIGAYAAEAGLVLVDAPVLGTRQPAELGKLVVLAAGPESVRPTVQPLFDTIGSRTVWIADDGAKGAASRLKLVLNTWVIALTNGVGEALSLAKGLDVDPRHFVDVITGGPLDSGYFQGKSAAVLAEDFTPSFTVDNAEKDARLAAEAARRTGLRLDGVEAGRDRFARASAQGHGGEDMAAVYFASFDDADAADASAASDAEPKV
ncbi:NAD(P)-dependent oxidoreductase [Streptomyces sp. NBC_00237]|uniref:NAD(P)-dependent oxidoreductase n=1 Tax=Streptomyces sp. NBC_00237 TaxID=2975687 RepID=UPI002256D6C0|nr:NAD(P)-dependent oxidoreductase [Streptomyces sp. NBC_00237]MCX5203463.1 NAD(P)-dependent oxidoreductase [Streptomyces sp. NBC_00237]